MLHQTMTKISGSFLVDLLQGPPMTSTSELGWGKKRSVTIFFNVICKTVSTVWLDSHQIFLLRYVYLKKVALHLLKMQISSTVQLNDRVCCEVHSFNT